MARAELGLRIEPSLGFRQKVATRFDSFLSELTGTKVLVADVLGQPLEPPANSFSRVELHRRYDGSGIVRKLITHVKDEKGEVVARETFRSEAELRQTWSKLVFKPL